MREVPAAFQQLLSKPGGWRPSLSGLNFKVIGSAAASKLEDPISAEEGFEALSELNEDKAPDPNGFSIAF